MEEADTADKSMYCQNTAKKEVGVSVGMKAPTVEEVKGASTSGMTMNQEMIHLGTRQRGASYGVSVQDRIRRMSGRGMQSRVLEVGRMMIARQRGEACFMRTYREKRWFSSYDS